jgi:hypothetical protein
VTTELQLSRYARARVWDGECPGARYQTAEIIRGEVGALREGTRARRIAVEIVQPKDPRVNYGLLGGEFNFAPGRSTVGVTTHYTETPFGLGDPFESPIAIAPERPLIGLPLELAKQVLIGVQDAHVQGVGLSPGILTIDCAAYGVLGSSPVFFRSLASVLTALLSQGWTSESDLRDVIEESLA